MLRKDYLTFLNCILLSMGAAFLPLVVLIRLFVLPYQLALAFLISSRKVFPRSVTFCVRTPWGSGLPAPPAQPLQV